jgi:class 3 adenylate cyclase
MNAIDIDALLKRYFGESTGSMRRCSVSELGRGECTSRPYFIFKIDLVNSTLFLKNQKPASYARIAHAYLSTIDAITQEFGAEPEQTEYQGDGVLALFPERGNTAIEIVSAAIQAHYAVNRLRHVSSMKLFPKIVLHHADLTVAKIGPWSETHRVAIGLPIHMVAKREELIKPGTIWLSESLSAKFSREFRLRLLNRIFAESTSIERVLVPTPPSVPANTIGGTLFSNLRSNSAEAGFSALASLNSFNAISGIPTYQGGISPPTNSSAPLSSLFGLGGSSTYQDRLLAAIRSLPTNPPASSAPHYEDRPVVKRTPDGYELNVIHAYQECGLPLSVLSPNS